MTQAWKNMVADAVAKPPAKRTPLEIESIRLAMCLQDLGKRLKRFKDQETRARLATGNSAMRSSKFAMSC